MTRAQTIAKAQELRQREGLSYAQLEERLGVPGSTLNEWLNAEVAARSRQRGKVSCPQCGGEMSERSTLCEECRHDQADALAREVEKWWAEGATFPEIQERLGWAKGTLSGALDRWREQGYSFPYRYKPGRRNATKYSEQVAA